MSVLLGLGVIAVIGWIAMMVFGRARADAAVDRERHRSEEHDRLVADRRGGAPDRPLLVESPAEIEPRVEREACPFCGGSLHVLAHEVEEHDDRLLRRVDAKCGSCGKPLATWFHVHAPLPN